MDIGGFGILLIVVVGSLVWLLLGTQMRRR